MMFLWMVAVLFVNIYKFSCMGVKLLLCSFRWARVVNLFFILVYGVCVIRWGWDSFLMGVS